MLRGGASPEELDDAARRPRRGRRSREDMGSNVYAHRAHDQEPARVAQVAVGLARPDHEHRVQRAPGHRLGLPEQRQRLALASHRLGQVGGDEDRVIEELRGATAGLLEQDRGVEGDDELVRVQRVRRGVRAEKGRWTKPWGPAYSVSRRSMTSARSSRSRVSLRRSGSDRPAWRRPQTGHPWPPGSGPATAGPACARRLARASARSGWPRRARG